MKNTGEVGRTSVSAEEVFAVKLSGKRTVFGQHSGKPVSAPMRQLPIGGRIFQVK